MRTTFLTTLTLLAAVTSIAFVQQDPQSILSRAESTSDPYDLVGLAQEMSEMGHFLSAVTILKKAVGLNALPREQQGQLEYNLAYALHEAGSFPEALEAFERVGKVFGIPDAYIKAARLCSEAGDLPKAATFLQIAIKIYDGGNPPVYSYLGEVLNNMKRFMDAAAVYKEGITVLRKMFERNKQRPDPQAIALAAKLHHGAGDALLNAKNYVAALEHFTSALRLAPNDGELLSSVMACHADLASWEGWEGREEAVVAAAKKAVAAEQVEKRKQQEGEEEEASKPSPLSPYQGLFLDLPHALRKNISSSWSRRLVAQARQTTSRTTAVQHRRRRGAGAASHLRLGYVSRRFEDYPGTHLMLGMFKRHDRNRTHIVCYGSGREDHSDARAAVAAGCDEFSDTSDMTGLEAAEDIRSDKLDVLVDYDGLHDYNNLAVLGQDPAATQVTFLGFAATTGQGRRNRKGDDADGSALDYMAVDAVTAPLELASSMFIEPLVYLAGSYQPQDPGQARLTETSQLRVPAPGYAPAGAAGVWGGAVTESPRATWEAERRRIRVKERLPAAAWWVGVEGEEQGEEEDDIETGICGSISVTTRVASQPALTRSRSTDSKSPDIPVVLSCFNRWHKIDPTMWRAWMNILAQTPRATLWLYGGKGGDSLNWKSVLSNDPSALQPICLSGKAGGAANKSASSTLSSSPQLNDLDIASMHMRNLVAEAAAAGIHPSRIIFATKSPRSSHLCRHLAADVQLDTRVYGAHTTAADGLFTGLPLVTLLGSGFASRVGASLLEAAAAGHDGHGHPLAPDAASSVCHGLAEYENVAVRLAHAPALHLSLRAQIGAGVAAAIARNEEKKGDLVNVSTDVPLKDRFGFHYPIYDAVSFTRHFETAMRAAAEAKQAARERSSGGEGWTYQAVVAAPGVAA